MQIAEPVALFFFKGIPNVEQPGETIAQDNEPRIDKKVEGEDGEPIPEKPESQDLRVMEGLLQAPLELLFPNKAIHIDIGTNEQVDLARIDGPGAIQHIWLTVHPTHWRRLVLRMWWDDEDEPSVEVPLGDFFCSGWGERCDIAGLPVVVNPAGGFNCYWPMPFRRSARISVENLTPDPVRGFYYQVTYTLTDVPADQAYLHAQWRRSNPVDPYPWLFERPGMRIVRI